MASHVDWQILRGQFPIGEDPRNKRHSAECSQDNLDRRGYVPVSEDGDEEQDTPKKC